MHVLVKEWFQGQVQEIVQEKHHLIHVSIVLLLVLTNLCANYRMLTIEQLVTLHFSMGKDSFWWVAQVDQRHFY